jgi:diguanylate cyclase (GGDEF)-like protein
VLARRVRTAVGSLPMLVSGSVTATITLSIGVAVAAPATDSRDLKSMAERLIAEADAALYRSKASGRDCLTVSNSLVT